MTKQMTLKTFCKTYFIMGFTIKLKKREKNVYRMVIRGHVNIFEVILIVDEQ